MHKLRFTLCPGKIGGHLIIGCLTVLLLLGLPTVTFADSPTPGAAPCLDCHQQETEAWQDSPHARADGGDEMPGATCEDCHGRYVEDHPDSGVMQLTVDSSVCKQCHSSTFGQWQASTHAQAGVQCIGCHLSHSQEFRLTDDALCGSCHRNNLEDFSHSAHDTANVACTDCHLSSTTTHQLAQANTNWISNSSIAENPGKSPGTQQNGTSTALSTEEVGAIFEQAGSTILAPDHEFTTVPVTNCIGCHGQDVHSMLPHPKQTIDARLLSMAESVPELTVKLETTEQENQSLQMMAPVCLGLGLGIGGMLGIIFMLVVGYIYQRRETS